MGLVARSWSSYVGQARQIHNEVGLTGLCSRLAHKIASPIVEWGGVTFFVRKLDPHAQPFVAPAGIEVRRATVSDLQMLNAGGDPTQALDDLVERLHRGDRAYAALTRSGQPAHLRWVTTRQCYIPEIDREIVLSPGQAYFYNGYTHPAMRAQGFDGIVRQTLFQTLAREGCEAVFSYVRRNNPKGFRAASRWQQPLETLWYLRVGRFAPLVIGRSRPGMPRLIKARAERGNRARETEWRRWFQSWLTRSLASRSTGCGEVSDTGFASMASFLQATLRLDPETDTVLDIGCDSAMLSRLIAPQCRRFLGIDFIAGMLRDARAHAIAVHDQRPAWFAAGDACRLPLRSRAFTKVYCSAVIHTLPSREHGWRAIEELVRVTAPGGTILISSVPDRARRLSRLAAIWRRSSWSDRLSLPIRWLVPGALKQRVRRMLSRPSHDLPEFLEYDLKDLCRQLEGRGLSCEIRDFPDDYWSRDFRSTRSNLLIRVPAQAALAVATQARAVVGVTSGSAVS